MSKPIRGGTVQGRAEAHHSLKFGPDVPVSTNEFFEVRTPPIRSSSMEQFEWCPRLYLYRNRMGIQPRGYSASLFRGGAFHRIMEYLFLGHSIEAAVGEARNLLEREGAKLRAEANPAGFLSGGTEVQTLIDEARMDFDKAQAMAALFWETHPIDFSIWKVLENAGGDPMVETRLEVSIPHISVPILITCDLALEAVRDDPAHSIHKGDICIVDHKTTSKDPLVVCDGLMFAPQIQLYRLALQRYLSVYRDPPPLVRHSLHNVIRTPTIRYCPLTKDKGGFESYLERVRAWYKERMERGECVMVQPHTILPTRITDELFLRLKQMSRAARCQPNLQRFYRAGGYRCYDRFNRPCPYRALCGSSPALWPQIVQDRFQISFREDGEEVTP